MRPTTSNTGVHLVAGPAFGLVRLAVAEGFEPSEAFTSRAFEARSLGRSDTPPPERLPKALRVRESEDQPRFHDRVWA